MCNVQRNAFGGSHCCDLKMSRIIRSSSNGTASEAASASRRISASGHCFFCVSAPSQPLSTTTCCSSIFTSPPPPCNFFFSTLLFAWPLTSPRSSSPSIQAFFPQHLSSSRLYPLWPDFLAPPPLLPLVARPSPPPPPPPPPVFSRH